MRQHVLQRHTRMIAIAILFALCAACMLAVQPAWALSADTVPDAPAGKWVKTSQTMRYKAKGSYLKGAAKIKGKVYYFDKKGVQRTGWRKVGDDYHFFKIANGASGYMVTSKVVNGVKLDKHGVALENKTTRAELKLMVAAQKRCDKIVKPLQSQSAKLRDCFVWVWKSCRERGSYSFSVYSGWHRKFAWDIFNTKSGSCDSLAIGYAYLANACGAKSVRIEASGGHTWAKVNGLVCDPEQAKQGRGWYVYMNSGLYGSAGIYKVNLAPRTKVWSNAKPYKKSKSKHADGWVKKNGKRYCYSNGKKLKKTWLTSNNKRYYLTATGAAATGSVKIAGTYYVFSSKGVLQTGTKTREVKVDGTVYRVSKKGTALKGWTSGKKRLYLANGALATGARLINGKLQLFSAKGVYKAEKSKTMRKLCVEGADATKLIAALGTPVKRDVVDTCRIDFEGGSEITYTYKNLRIYTYCAPDGPELFNYIEAI